MLKLVEDKEISVTCCLEVFELDNNNIGWTEVELVGIITRNGKNMTVNNDGINESIANYLQVQQQGLETRDLREEWGKSMDAPIQAVGDRLGKLKLDGRLVKVHKRCERAKVDELYTRLKKINPKNHPGIRYAAQWNDVPKLQRFFDKHVSMTPYSMSITKCGSDECLDCIPIWAPKDNGVRSLVMQRQPTPRLDSRRPGHFMSRKDAIAKFDGQPLALKDLSDLPSKQTPNEVGEVFKQKKVHDKEVAVSKKLKSWDPSNVRGFVNCW